MTSKQKLAQATYPGTMTLYQRQWIRWAEVVGSIVPLALGLHMMTTHAENVVVGLLLAAAAAVMITLAVRDLRTPHSLTLNANGFRIRSGHHQVTYRWTEIQHFREVGDGDRFAVGFDLISLDGPDVAPDERVDYYFRLREHYGLGGAELLSLLTQWHAKALGLSNPKRGSRSAAD